VDEHLRQEDNACTAHANQDSYADLDDFIVCDEGDAMMDRM
jgi:hypothetical protein